MQSGNKRAFILTADAIICLIIVISLITTISYEQENLNKEVLFQQAQDIVEACTIIEELNNECFDNVKTNNIDYCWNDCENPMIKRNYIEFSLLLK